MFSTDYLVICGRAFARSMESASATSERPLDGSKHIIAQFLCPVQCSLMARVPTIGSLCPPIRGSERECLMRQSYCPRHAVS